MLTETEIPGCFLVRSEPMLDERGWFMRTFDARVFQSRGLNSMVSQSSVSFNPKPLTLRGLHYQAAPYEEAKTVRCMKGAIFDVVLDLRPQSPKYLKWHAEELSERNCLALYVPEGTAHGFLSLEPNSEVSYQISSPHMPSAALGVRWDDPLAAIRWPSAPQCISTRDASWPDWPAND